MPELKIYTVKDLREWLEDNHPAEGLSERVIAPTRAWAIIHNPYVKDEDAIVAAIFEDGELAAYTASFPDMLEGKRVWWASTLYCYPKFTGKGYGLIVVGSLMEAHEPELTYDRWGAKETVEIFNHLGYKTIHTPRYFLSDKKIDTTTFKGKLAASAQYFKKCFHPWSKPLKAKYALCYTSFVDGETYAFMKAHKGNDLWLREQEMLNWELRYSFTQGCTLLNRVIPECEFGSNVASVDFKVVKVYFDNQLVGVYVIRTRNNAMGLVYIYYDGNAKELVYTSILDHIIAISPTSIELENAELTEYINKRIYFPKMHEEMISFSLPPTVEMPSQCLFQLGDGDSFL